MKVLFVSRWYPFPPDNGSKIRVLSLIEALASHHRVDLVSFASGQVEAERLAAMRRYCQTVEVVRYEPFRPGRPRALLAFLSRRPRWAVDTYSHAMQRLVDGRVRELAPDVVVFSEIDMAGYAMNLPHLPTVLEDLELTALYEQFAGQPRLAGRLRYGLTWWKHRRYVTDLLPSFAGCTVVSEQERGRLHQFLPGYRPVAMVPNGVDVSSSDSDYGPPQPDTLVYAGSLTYSANYDAVAFFLREVFPLIRARRPGVELRVTGRLDGVPVDRLPLGDGVTLTGYLKDVRPTVARSWVSIVPLRVGGGTRVKVLEALALGTPVVATRKGVEGLDLQPGRDLLVADDPAEFASSVLRLLQDRELRESLGRDGRRAVLAGYDWQAIGRRFDGFLEQVVAATGPAGIER